VERLSPKQIVDSFKKELSDGFIDGTIYEREVAVKKNRFRSLWIKVRLEAFHHAVEHICRLEKYPHLAIISSSDLGSEVELIYHFTIYFGHHLEELSVGLKVLLSKSNLRIPTVTDLIPGAIFTERETQEMMGVEVVGIPDGRRLFVAAEIPEGVYPWRKDETGPEKYLRVLPGRKAKGKEG
jgi:membrane-bound hydrogenase subunit beta